MTVHRRSEDNFANHVVNQFPSVMKREVKTIDVIWQDAIRICSFVTMSVVFVIGVNKSHDIV